MDEKIFPLISSGELETERAGGNVAQVFFGRKGSIREIRFIRSIGSNRFKSQFGGSDIFGWALARGNLRFGTESVRLPATGAIAKGWTWAALERTKWIREIRYLEGEGVKMFGEAEAWANLGGCCDTHRFGKAGCA